MVIRVLDYVDKGYSNQDGEIIADLILKSFKKNEKVVVSFEGITCLTSSFVNTAFADLLFVYDFDYIKNNLQFIKSTRQINQIIQKSFSVAINKKELLYV